MDRLIPFLLSRVVSWRCVSACLVSVPLTHGVGIHLHLSKLDARDRFKYLLYPFRGGNRHIVFQLLSWVLWGFALLTILPVSLAMLPFSASLPKDIPTIPHSHVDVVSGAAAVVSFVAEVLMIKAVLVYESRAGQTVPAAAAAAAAAAAVPLKQRHLQPHPVVASAVVVVLGLALSVTGALLLMALEYMPDIPSRVLYCCLSLSCLLIASSTTYGLGGHLRYASSTATTQDSAGALGGMWQFFQPFSGGTAFVTTQAISWSLFAGTVVLVVALMQQLVAGVAHCFRCWAVGTGCLMLTVQAMLALSLLFFRAPKNAAAQLMRAASGALAISSSSSGKPQQCWRDALLPVMLMYCPVHCFFTLWSLAFVFLPLRVAVACWLGFLVPYYTLTLRGNPAHTGCRQWPWLMSWFKHNVEGSLTTCFGSLTVVYDGDPPGSLAVASPADKQDLCNDDGSAAEAEKASTQQQTDEGSDSNFPAVGRSGEDHRLPASSHKQPYMFGFQPHALYPTGAGFLPWMPSFRQHFPDHAPITLTASVIFFPPFIKDICCWAGFRQVSKPTFLSALDERGAVMFCPGGQAEMLHAWKAFLLPEQRKVVLHTGHKGFCRIAIERQAVLVPVLALGENLQLRNLFNLPALQQFTYKRLGFPAPFILCGRYGVTPFPRKVPLLYVIGRPLQPPPLAPGQAVEAADVDELHRRYYSSLVDLFERYKRLHPEFQQASIVLTDD